MFLFFFIFFSIFFLFYACIKKSNPITKKNILIIGGSSGLGLSLAKVLVSLNNKVTITSRSKKRLKVILNENKGMRGMIYNSNIDYNNCDYNGDFNIIPNSSNSNITYNTNQNSSNQNKIECINNNNFDYIFYCPGIAIPGYFYNQSPSIFLRQMNLNFLDCIKAIYFFIRRSNGSNRSVNEDSNYNGSVNENSNYNGSVNEDSNYNGSVNEDSNYNECIKSNLKSNIKEFPNVTFIMVSSTTALFPIPGYSSYSPSKISLKSFFDSSFLEFKNLNVNLKILYCCSMKTPGLLKEDKTKPEFTKKIEYSNSIVSSDEIAKYFIYNLNNRNSLSYDWFTYFSLIRNECECLIDYFMFPFSIIVIFISRIYVNYKFRRFVG